MVYSCNLAKEKKHLETTSWCFPVKKIMSRKDILLEILSSGEKALIEILVMLLSSCFSIQQPIGKTNVPSFPFHHECVRAEKLCGFCYKWLSRVLVGTPFTSSSYIQPPTSLEDFRVGIWSPRLFEGFLWSLRNPPIILLHKEFPRLQFG